MLDRVWPAAGRSLCWVGKVDADAMTGHDAERGLGFRVGARMFSHSCLSLRCGVVAEGEASSGKVVEGQVISSKGGRFISQ